MKQLGIMLVLGVMPVLTGTAAANWSDNFNDNTAQQTWTSAGSGVANVQNDRYELSTTVSGESDQVIAPYVATDTATDCVLTGRVQEIASGDVFLAYLGARLDPMSGSGYLCGISSGGNLWLGKLVGGAYQSLAGLSEQPDFDPTDCQVAFSLTGSTLKGKVWSSGAPEPEGWQIEATDSDYTEGYGGIMAGTYRTLGWDTVNVAFDDVSMVPEPATLTFLALGGLMMLRRRRHAA